MTFNQPEINIIINSAMATAKKLNHKYLTTEHLLISTLTYPNFNKVLLEFGVDVNALVQEITDFISKELPKASTGSEIMITPAVERVLNYAGNLTLSRVNSPTSIPTITCLDVFCGIYSEKGSHSSYFITKYNIKLQELIDFCEKNKNLLQASTEISKDEAESLLQENCVNLNLLAKDGKIDTLVGRENEISEITRTLAKRNKSNVLIVGDPGIGKSCLVEGFAQKIVNNQVPNYLRDWTVWSLDVGSLLAGCRYRGDFEEKLQNVMKSLITLGKCILFVDEAHLMKGAGSSSGGGSQVDFANMIKPAIAKGKIKIIASTTWEEYHKSFDNDRALMRRFYRISLTEPTAEEAKLILKGSKSQFETFHNGKILDEAIDTAVDLSIRYQLDKRLPDKAIDLIDSACARAKIIENKEFIIDRNSILVELSTATNIPIQNLDKTTSTNFTKLEEETKSEIFGQDESINKIFDRLFINQSGLKNPNKPIGSFLFVGPTGVGKTMTAKVIAQKTGMKLLKYDMSEYQEKNSIARFIGAPPGYVGFGDGAGGDGQLINDIEKNPNSILLFDESDKAHPDVMQLFLQMMDEGTVTSSNGKKADCRNCIIILSSNLGAADSEKLALGFYNDSSRQITKETKTVEVAVKEFLKPEFRGRLNGICHFNKLTDIDMRKIIVQSINNINLLLSQNSKIKIRASESLIEHIFSLSKKINLGGRPIENEIEKLITVPLSKMIVTGKIKHDSTILLNWVNNKLSTQEVLDSKPEELQS